MNPIIEFLKQTEGTVFVNEDGFASDFMLKPPLVEQQLRLFEASLPCALPEEIRELLRFANGFDGVLDGVEFVDSVGFGSEDRVSGRIVGICRPSQSKTGRRVFMGRIWCRDR